MSDLTGKELHRLVGIGLVLTSIRRVYLVSTLAQNGRDVGSIPTLDTIFPIFIKPMTRVVLIMIPYKLCAVWLLNLPCVGMFMYGHCLYICNCKH